MHPISPPPPWMVCGKVDIMQNASAHYHSDQDHRREPKSCTTLKAMVSDILEVPQQEALISPERERSRQRHSHPSRSFLEKASERKKRLQAVNILRPRAQEYDDQTRGKGLLGTRQRTPSPTERRQPSPSDYWHLPFCVFSQKKMNAVQV